MCGRIALYTEPERMARFLDAGIAEDELEGWRQSWNVGPTRQILAVAESPDGVRTLGRYRWGLRPGWLTDLKKPQPFNARAETVARSGMFAAAFKRQRVLVPVDGFYEWHPKGQKGAQPYFFHRADDEPLVFAGLREFWRSPGAGEVHSATIITTEAGPDMSAVHDREPVVLERDAWEIWLDPKNDDRDELESLLHPTLEGTVVHHPVSKDVGATRNDGPELVQPA